MQTSHPDSIYQLMKYTFLSYGKRTGKSEFEAMKTYYEWKRFFIQGDEQQSWQIFCHFCFPKAETKVE
jgi:hypothetical protein